MPTLARLDHRLEFSEALERHRDGERHIRTVQRVGDGLVEEGAVDARLNRQRAELLSHPTYAVCHEGFGAVGVVYIPER